MRFDRVFRCIAIVWISSFASLTAGYAVSDKKEVDEAEGKGNRTDFLSVRNRADKRNAFLLYCIRL